MNPYSERLVIIPCRNESATITTLVEKIHALSLRILVVDDASVDRTYQLAREAGADVIQLKKCSGKGTALRVGFEYSLENGIDTVITLDGDGQHRPEEIVDFIKEHEESGAELVVGNRMKSPEGMPKLRKRTNRLMSAILSRQLGHSFPDTQCGFRLFKLTPEFVASLKTVHFEIESEALVNAVHFDWNIRFIPISCIYEESQISQIRPIIDTIRWIQWYLKTRNGKQQ